MLTLDDKHTTEINIGFAAGADGEYTLNSNFDHSAFNTLTIEDRKLNHFQNLIESGTYTFTGSINDNPARFILHVNATGLEEQSHKSNFRIWSEGNTLYIHNPEAKSGEIHIISMQGQILISKVMKCEIKQEYPLNIKEGYYVVRITTNDFVVNKKLYLK